MSEWKDKDLELGDQENVKKAIDDTRNAAMKIGQSMSQGGASGSSDQSTSDESSSSENKDEEKKNWFYYVMFIYTLKILFI